MLKMEGCDKISEEMLLSWLGEYVEIKPELMEDVFDDAEDSKGENATGPYSKKLAADPDPKFPTNRWQENRDLIQRYEKTLHKLLLSTPKSRLQKL